MRALLLAVALLAPAVLVLPAPSQAAPYVWSVEAVDTRGLTEQVSLALDGDGNPHIAYYESSGQDLRYAHWNGTAWVREDVDTAGDVGGSPSITVDSQGRPHLAYMDVTNDILKHGIRENGTWRGEAVDSVWSTSVADPRQSSSVMGPGDTPLICYVSDSGLGNVVRFAWKSGPTWTNETVDGGSGGDGQYCSIALDVESRPRISYQKGGDLWYAAWNGASWDTSLVDAADGVSSWTSLALDASGNPFIAYRTANSFGGKIAYWDGASWRTLVPASNAPDAHHFPAIAFDSLDRLHAPSFVFAPPSSTYSVWNGAWTNETFPEPFGQLPEGGVALAVDANGLPHLAWTWDGDLYYARAFATPQRPAAPRNLQAAAGEAEVSLTWTAPAWDGGSGITGYRVYRGTVSNPTTPVATLGNVTAWTDTAVTNNQAYHYRVVAINGIGEGPPSNEVTAVPSEPGNDPPTCAITSPAGGTVQGTVTVSGTAADPESSVDRVEVRIDGGSWDSATGPAAWTYAWNSSAVPDGPHTIEARAYDGALYSTPCSVTVTTDNGVAPPDGTDGVLGAYGWLVLLLVLAAAIPLLLLAFRRRRRKGVPP